MSTETGEGHNAPERWKLWLADEQVWIEEQAPEWGRVLATGDPTEAIQVARELAQHPLLRERVAALLRPGLGRDEVGVLRTTCTALCGLGSLSVARELVPPLSSQEQSVRESACTAPETLVGERLGSKPKLGMPGSIADPPHATLFEPTLFQPFLAAPRSGTSSTQLIRSSIWGGSLPGRTRVPGSDGRRQPAISSWFPRSPAGPSRLQ